MDLYFIGSVSCSCYIDNLTNNNFVNDNTAVNPVLYYNSIYVDNDNNDKVDCHNVGDGHYR